VSFVNHCERFSVILATWSWQIHFWCRLHAIWRIHFCWSGTRQFI